MKLITIILIFMILLPASLVSAQEGTETQTQADAGSVAHGTVSAGAGVSVSSDETMASAAAHAESSSTIAASITDVITSGRNVESYSFSVSDNTGSITGSVGTAIGNLISLLSRSTAIGKNVYGEGGASVTSSQSASAGVMTETILLNNGLYQITVQAVGNGESDASGTVYTIAWAIDQLQPIVQPVQVQERAFYGYTFGKCDVQRYKHFWLQLRDNNTDNDDRAKYNMELIAEGTSNRVGEYAITEFEERYNISYRYPPEILNGNDEQNGVWCTMPNKKEP